MKDDEEIKREEMDQVKRLLNSRVEESEEEEDDLIDHESRMDQLMVGSSGRSRHTQNPSEVKRPKLQEQQNKLTKSFSEAAAPPKQSRSVSHVPFQQKEQRLDQKSASGEDSQSSDSEEEQKNNKLFARATNLLQKQQTAAEKVAIYESDSVNSDSSSEQEDSEVSKKIMDIAKRNENNQMKLGTALRVAVYDKAGPVTLVELNESHNKKATYRINVAQNLLQNFHKDFYNVERQIINFTELPQLSNQLYKEHNHAYFGEVSCIRLFKAKNGMMAFIGNTSGYIQVFDTQSQKQCKPLYHPRLAKNGVTCMDISENGQYLLAGYKKGTLALWDCSRFRLAHIMQDIARDENSAFVNIKILFTAEQNVLNVVTAEESGRMRQIQMQRGVLGKFKHVTGSLLKNVTTIEVQRPNKQDKQSFCHMACLTAFGESSTVTIVDMKNDVGRPVKIIQRPPICFERSLPSFSWGYGLTPLDRNTSKHLLAIAWDKTIMLITVQDETQDIELFKCGYYCSDLEINQIYFVSDSLLAIVINGDQVKILSTEKFKAGQLYQLTQNKQPNEVIKNFKAAVQSSKNCELETDHHINGLNRNIQMYSFDKVQQTASYSNYDNTVTFHRRNMAFLCNQRLVIAKIPSWQDLIDKLVHKQGEDWLTVLKAAIEIFTGDMKGFALLPAGKEQRQEFMKDYMKNLLFTSIEAVFDKYKDTEPASATEEGGSFSIQEVAIKVSIEYCLVIQDAKFLFDKIYNYFVQKGFEQQFVYHLTIPIISGSFLQEYVPHDLLLQLIRIQEKKQEYHIIEQIILNVNVESYNDQVDKKGEPIKSILVAICKKHVLVGGALLLLSTAKKLNLARKGSTMILKLLLQNMETQKADIQNAILRGEKPQLITKEDMRMLRNANKSRRIEVEQSAYYQGYRLFWILGLFLFGKKFPDGKLAEVQYKLQVFNIVDFVTDEDNLASMLDFDSEAFFGTIAKLFSGEPWRFMTNSGQYKFKWQREKDASAVEEENQEQKTDDTSLAMCNIPIISQILTILKEAAFRAFRKEPAFTKASFKEFILNIMIQQGLVDQNAIAAARIKGKRIQQLTIDYDLAYDALKSLFKIKRHGEQSVVADQDYKRDLDESLIVSSIQVIPLKEDHIKELLELCENILESGATNINIYQVKVKLFEKREDYYSAFLQYLNQESERMKIFLWLNETLEKLKREEIEWKRQQGFLEGIKEEEEEIQSDANSDEEEKIDHTHKYDDDDEGADRRKSSADQVVEEDKNPYPPFANLKQTVKSQMLRLAQYNSELTIELIESYFASGDFQENFIMTKFSKYPNEQLQFLRNFIMKHEKEIELTMSDRTRNPANAKKYQRYLEQFTKLLCSISKDEVESWVSKIYFPVEQCLQVCINNQHQIGEAILTMRSGRPFDAITLYTQIMTEFPILGLLEQINLLYKDEPTFLQGLVNENDYENENSDMTNFQGQNLNSFALQQIANFDKIVGKACQICLIDELDIEERQKGWFQVLRYLNKFKHQADTKCEEAINQALKIFGNERFSSIRNENKSEFEQKLISFIDVRIMYILRFPRLSIPLKQLVEQLKMTNDQIKNLTQAKMKHSETTFQIETTQNIVMKGQLCDMFQDELRLKGHGFLIEPKKRFEKRNGRAKVFVNSVCSICLNSITDDNYLSVFACGHSFHVHCLRQQQHENQSKKCPVCLKINYTYIREEIEKELAKQAKKRQQNVRQSDDLEVEQQESGPYGDFNEDEEEDMEKFYQNIQFKKLDQYDVILDDINLELSEFLEEMAN